MNNSAILSGVKTSNPVALPYHWLEPVLFGWLILKLLINIGVFSLQALLSSNRWLSKTSLVAFALLFWISTSWFRTVTLTYRSHFEMLGYQQALEAFKQDFHTQQYQYWLSELEKSPTHREILLQTAFYACVLDEVEECQQFYQQAVKIDPNHPRVAQFYQQFLAQDSQKSPTLNK